MAEGPAGRRGQAGDKGHHWFGVAGPGHVFGELLLGPPPHFADDHDREHPVVVAHHLAQIHEFRPAEGIPADAGGHGLSDADGRKPRGDLVGQGAAARKDRHRAGGKGPLGHDAGMEPPGQDEARRVRSEEKRPGRPRQGPSNGEHAQLRDAVGDAHDAGDAGFDRLEDGVHRPGGGHEEDGKRDVVPGPGLGHGIVHRDAVHLDASPEGGHAADHLGAVGPHAPGVQAADAARQPLDEHARSPVEFQQRGQPWPDQTGTPGGRRPVPAVCGPRQLGRPPRQGMRDFGKQGHGLVHVVGHHEASHSQPAQQRRPRLGAVAGEPHDDRARRGRAAQGADQGLGHVGTGKDASEHVDAARRHRRIGEKQVEGGPEPHRVGRPAEIQEIGRRQPRRVQGVHGGHGQPRAVGHQPDHAGKADIGEAVPAGLAFGGRGETLVDETGQFGIEGQRRVVDDHLGVQGHEPALRRQSQGVDLGQEKALSDDGAEQPGQKFLEGRVPGRGQPQMEKRRPGQARRKAEGRRHLAHEKFRGAGEPFHPAPSFPGQGQAQGPALPRDPQGDIDGPLVGDRLLQTQEGRRRPPDGQGK